MPEILYRIMAAHLMWEGAQVMGQAEPAYMAASIMMRRRR